MAVEHLTSLKNPRIQAFRSLKERKGRQALDAFLVEGDKMVTEALLSDYPVRCLLLREDRAPSGLFPGGNRSGSDRFPMPADPDLPVCVLPGHVFASLSDAKTPQGVAAVVGRRPRARAGAPEEAPGPHLIALDGVQDPGNVGTILRTADAAGASGMLLGPDCADLFAPKTLRATMGSIFRVPLFFPESLPSALLRLRDQGYAILSSQLDGAPFYQRPDIGEKWVLIIGNEGNGISPPVRETATLRLRLPMRGGAESLNAGVAAGIMMYELMRDCPADE